MATRRILSLGVLAGVVGVAAWLIVGTLPTRANPESSGEGATGAGTSESSRSSDQIQPLLDEVRRLTLAVHELNERVSRLQTSRGTNQTPQKVVKRPAVPIPVYTRPALAQFNAMIQEIATAFDELRQSGNVAKADEFARELESFKKLPGGDYSSVKTSEAEVHVIGLYEAASSRNHSNAPAKVRVTYTGGPIVLVLTAYEPVSWDIELADGVQIQTALVCGYYRQEIHGLPERVPVLKDSHEGGSGRMRFYAYSKTSDGYGSLVKGIRETPGSELTTFQGAYRYPGTPFVIGPENHEWRYQHLIAQMRFLHAEATQPSVSQAKQAADDLRFTSVYVTGADRYGHSGSAAHGEFTANGPIAAKLTPLPRGCQRAVLDPRNATFYAISGHGLVRFEKGSKYEDQTLAELTMPVELPRLSWPCGIAFDTKPNRVVISTLGGEGFLYSYEPDAKKWSIISSLRNVDYSGITYDPAADCFFALTLSHGESSAAQLHRLTADGALEKSFALADPFPAIRHLTICQLAAAKDKLVILAPSPVSTSDYSSPTNHIYVINPETGAVTYQTEMKPRK